MIVKASKCNIEKLVELGLKLWPDNQYTELMDDFESSIISDNEDMFLYEDEEKCFIGFMQLSVRAHYVEGCDTIPVAYLEGIFVEEHARRSGIAQEMVRYAEDWGKNKGCSELGSDCELENTLSIDFHNAVGFEEANRLVCFIKKISK